MGHNHSHHHHHHDLSGKKLLWTTLLNFIIAFAEIVGGILSNSLALISDALHNFSDAVAIFIAYVANRISKKQSNINKTYGYKRIEILSALFNSVVLVVVSIYLFIEAYHRFYNPQEIKGKLMLIVAVIGLLANLASVFILKKDSKKNINIKAAYLHLLGDTISSVAVIIGGILIYYFKIYWIDTIITVLIGLYIIKETWEIIKESVNILMQSTPADLDLQQLTIEVENIPEISNIHHIHAWNLDDSQTYFECHIELSKDLKLSEADIVRQKVKELLQKNFGISHITMQIGYDCCDNKEMIQED